MLLLLHLQKLPGNLHTTHWDELETAQPNPLSSKKQCYKIHQVLIELLFDDDTAVHVATHTKYKLKTTLEGSPTHLPNSGKVEEKNGHQD